MPYGTVNADVIQTSTSGGILGAGNASIMKNRIINGAMVIAQRTTSAVTTDNSFPVDRFNVWNGTSQGQFSAIQDSSAPVGFVNSLKYTVTTADSSLNTDEYSSINQRIEGYNISDLGWGTANAKTVTLSFWANCSLTGTFGGAIVNSDQSRSYPFSYTISSANTWTQISVTIPGDTTGTWLTTNGIGMQLRFGMYAGSDYTSAAGTWVAANRFGCTGMTQVMATLNATFFVTGVQIEVGSSATGFEYRIYGTELMNCQRYFYRKTSDTVTDALVIPSPYNLTATNAWAAWWHPVTMRTIPTYSNGASFAGGSPATVNPGIRHLIMQFTNGTYYIQGTTTFDVSAEL